MMIGRARTALVIAALVLWGSSGGLARAAEAAASDTESRQLLRNAQLIQLATRDTLRILGGATRCADARYVSYRRSDREPDVVDQWYVVSQLWADAALLSSDRGHLRARPSGGAVAK